MIVYGRSNGKALRSALDSMTEYGTVTYMQRLQESA